MINYVKKNLTLQYNLGDDFCTPDRYFNISCNNNLTIIGGGAYVEYGLKRCAKSKIDTSKTIAWGIGESRKSLVSKEIKSLPYLDWGIRDKSSVDASRFLPCVSCFNKDIMLEPTANETMIFLNANKKVSGDISGGVFNDTSLASFLAKWNKSSKIITNSYHGIYWALLTGREVIPFGYSTKFLEVFNIFDLVFPQESLYTIKDGLELEILIKKLSTISQTFKINNYHEYKMQFQTLNLEFATRLQKYNITCNLK